MFDASVGGSRETGHQQHMPSNQKSYFIACLFTAIHLSVSLGADRFPDDLAVVTSVAPIPIRREVDWEPTLDVGRGPERDHVPIALHGCRSPGEFEYQRALLLGCHDLITTAPELIVELVGATQNRIEILALVSNVEEYEATANLLRASAVSQKHVHFVELHHDTMWARDYGPTIVESKEGRLVVIDADYDLGRPNDDRVPEQLAHLLNLELVRVPLRIDGGNLISNGRGLAITTNRLVDENAAADDVEAMCNAIGHVYGIKQVAILEPLVGEATGHVDMFAAFTSENTVVVGELDPEIDAENAAILDRNAAHLSTMQTVNGALRVVRIPMPSNKDGVWRTYTNVIFANGALLVPTYADADQTVQKRALSTYAKLMPHWKIVGIDASRVIESNGALHCISMNLGPLRRLPEFPCPRTHAADQLDVVEDMDSRTELEHVPLTHTSVHADPDDGNRFCVAVAPIRHSNHDRRAIVGYQTVNGRRLGWLNTSATGFTNEALTTTGFSNRFEFAQLRPLCPNQRRIVTDSQTTWNRK